MKTFFRKLQEEIFRYNRVLHDPSQKIILIKIIVIIIKNSKIMEGFQIKKSPFPGSPSTPVLNQMPQQA